MTNSFAVQASESEAVRPALTQQSATANNRNALLQTVARKYKVSPFRQFADIYKLKKGVNGLNPREYYDLEVYRPDLTPEQKRCFVGERGSFALNLELAPPNITQMRGFLSDKVTFTALLAQLGLRTTTTQAVISTNRHFGTVPTLRTAEDLRVWLQTSARYPLFGKLISGTQAVGSVSITKVADGIAHLASGDMVPLDQLVAEILAEKDTGFLFQDRVEQHLDISARANTTSVSTIRVVTVVEDGKPRVLYALWKIPGAKAMSDNFWQNGSMIGEVEPTSGKVLTMRKGTGPDTEWPVAHPATGETLVGTTIPEWKSVIDIALEAHAIFPINGILGWDIAVDADGARIIECNENPHHGLYQLATARGILNDAFTPVFKKIKAANAQYMATFSAKTKAYVGKRARF